MGCPMTLLVRVQKLGTIGKMSADLAARQEVMRSSDAQESAVQLVAYGGMVRCFQSSQTECDEARREFLQLIGETLYAVRERVCSKLQGLNI
jgi:hypothetical protein